MLLPPSYRFSARCFLTSTARGKPGDPPLAQKKTFGSSKIGWKDDDGERFSTPANPQMKPYIQTIPKVDWFPEQKTADQMYSRKKKKRKSSLVERMFLG